MISRHHQTEAFRRDLVRDLEKQIPYSTDPQRLRELAGVHQYNGLEIASIFVLGMFIAFACSVVW